MSEESSDNMLEQMNTLESLYHMVESTPTFSVEHLSMVQAVVDIDIPAHTLESSTGDELREITLEGIGDFWNRIKQSYVSAWHTQVDGWNQLIGGYRKLHEKHSKINAKLRAQWNGKKGSLKSDKHIMSVSGESVSMAMFIDGNLTKDPVRTLAEDLKTATYVMGKYPQDMMSYAEKLSSIVSRGKYDDDKSFESSVLKPIVTLGHPRNVFTLKLPPKGLGLHSNFKLVEKVGKSKAVSEDAGKDHSSLAVMVDGTYVKHSLLGDKLFGADVVRDIELTPQELDTLLSHHMSYASVLKDLSGRLTGTVNGTKKILKEQEKAPAIGDLNNANKRAVSDIAKLVKSMAKYLKAPMNMEANRVVNMVNATRMICSRTIATWK